MMPSTVGATPAEHRLAVTTLWHTASEPHARPLPHKKLARRAPRGIPSKLYLQHRGPSGRSSHCGMAPEDDDSWGKWQGSPTKKAKVSQDQDID
jgi:hypothetical protein